MLIGPLLTILWYFFGDNFMKTEILDFVLFLQFLVHKYINTTNSKEIGYFVLVYDAGISSFQIT